MATKGKKKASFPSLRVDPEDLARLTHRDHLPELYANIVKKYSGGRSDRTPEEYTNMSHKLARKDQAYTFGFIDLFAGIGGFRLAGQNVGGRCLFTSEWDPYARKAYFINFGQYPFGDITQFTKTEDKLAEIPSHRVLCGGFPCQAFSISGKQEGFKDPRGTLFFEIYKIAKFHKPEILFLENVKNFARHDGGETFKAVKGALEETILLETKNKVGYRVSSVVLNASDFGAPTKRERIYIVAVRNDLARCDENWDEWVQKLSNLGKSNGAKPTYLESIMQTINEDDPVWRNLFVKRPAKYGKNAFKEIPAACKPIRIGTFGKGGQGERIYSTKGHAITFSAYGGGVASKTGAYSLGGNSLIKPRKLTPAECAKAMGFKGMDVSTGDVPLLQRYKQFGNSVVVNVVEAIFKEINEFWLQKPKRR
jgi:DNA (cytosine-5)-methyltransferase 1